MKKILNVGCGGNEYGTHFIDLFPRNKQTIKWDANTEPIPFEDGFFDKVFCSLFIENTYNAGALIKEMLRVLKPGGNLLIRVDNSHYWVFCLDNSLQRKGYEGTHGRGDYDRHYETFNEWHMWNHLKDYVDNFKVEFLKEGHFHTVKTYKFYIKKAIGFLLRMTPLWRMSYMTIEINCTKKNK